MAEGAEREAKKIIIDTDPGIDDAMAIFVALQSPEVQVIGITTIYGNVYTTLATRNALHLLEVAGRTDIPVAEGSHVTITADGMKAMLVIQSLRNTQMVAIFTASTAIALSLTLAALTNNAYNASHLVIKSPFFGSQSGSIFALKYGLASFLMLFSSLFSSMATGFLIDTIFLINASFEFSYSGITETQLERGYMLALIGNRLLCISFPMLLWLFGPVPVALSSLALVWWLYELDFAAKLSTSSRQSLS